MVIPMDHQVMKANRTTLFFLKLLRSMSYLPFPVLYCLSDCLYIFLYYFFRYRKKVVHENLINAFPEKNDEERRGIEKKFYRHLADLFVESIKMLTISSAEVNKRVIITNPELLTDNLQNGQGVIGVLGHYGNWELNALRFSLLTEQPRFIVYKPLSDTVFDDLLLQMRSRFGATLVPMKSVLRKLLQNRCIPTATVLLADQTPAKSEVQYFTTFLNQPTAVFLGVEKLAKASGNAVLFYDVRQVKRGHYQCTLVPLCSNPCEAPEHHITDTHVQYLDRVIRQEPAYWLWSHRRWKHKPL